MRIGQQSFDKPAPMDVFLTHGNDEVHLQVQAVMDYKTFEKMVPTPVPPKIKNVKTKEETFDLKDRKYLADVQTYAAKKTAYMLIESLAATKDLTWDTVEADKPDTWLRAEGELEKAFTEFGLRTITQAVLRVNGLCEDMVEQGRQSFLASRSRQKS